jgi:hypothetical protein
MKMAAFSVSGEKLLQRALQAEQQGNRSLAAQLRTEAETQALNDVFGLGFRRDAHGNPIEQGVGSDSNPSERSFAAIEKYEGKAAADAARARAARLKGGK